MLRNLMAGRRADDGMKRRIPAWLEFDPLDIACAAALGVEPREVRPRLVIVQPSTGSVVAADAACPLMVMETFRGILLRVYEPLRPVIEDLVREGRKQGAALSAANRERLVEAVMARLPIIDVWHDLVHYTDRAHFVPWIEHKVRRVAGGGQGRAGGEANAGAESPFAAAYGIYQGGRLVSYADIVLRGDYACSIAVFTEPEFRGRGMGKSVVSAATKAVLKAGRIPLYATDEANLGSLGICRSLGYLKFGEDLYCFMAPEEERARREESEREAERKARDYARHRWVVD